MGARLLSLSLDSDFGQVSPFTAVHRQMDCQTQQAKVCVWSYLLWLLLQLDPQVKDVSDCEGRDRATLFHQKRKNTFQVVQQKFPLKMEFILNFMSSFFLANKYLVSLHTSGGWEVAAGGL